VPYLPRNWRWYHASVYRRLTVLKGKKDEYGRFLEKPEVTLAYDPDERVQLHAVLHRVGSGDGARRRSERDENHP